MNKKKLNKIALIIFVGIGLMLADIWAESYISSKIQTSDWFYAPTEITFIILGLIVFSLSCLRIYFVIEENLD